jgi:hypothetical protein
MPALRSLRSLLPLTLGLVSGSLLLILLGGVTTVLVAAADRVAPVRSWRRGFPQLSFAGVRRFPRDQDGVVDLAALCSVCAAAADELGEVPRRRRRELRRRIGLLVRMGADLTVARAKLDAVDAPEARVALEGQINLLVPTATQLQATLLRAGANRAVRVDELHALRRCEQELRAVEEVTEMDRWTRYAS